jgi:hypothetical protein
MSERILVCDGCGQPGTPEHIARRLKRLELATRFRPIHMQTVYLGAAPDAEDSAFLYATEGGNFRGESAAALECADIASTGKTREAVLVEFQRSGAFLTHVLECPFEKSADAGARQELLRARLPHLLVRLKRSLRPKRIVLLSAELHGLADQLREIVSDVETAETKSAPNTH